MNQTKRKIWASLLMAMTMLWFFGNATALTTLQYGNTPTTQTTSDHNNPCNPCAAKSNPCNPCAAKKWKNPCNPCNPCASKANPCNPCGGKSTFKMSPYKKKSDAIAAGNKLFHNTNLSGSKALSCSVCHNPASKENLDLTTSKPWPHYVKMGGGIISLDQIIQICMVKPMQSTAFKWDDPELVALGAYVNSLRK
ncbi:MAG: hypothetical protein HQM14_15185 [SAR324 cluster bacterium]|nr:hypothetical protein [SAR324 cluster bacterium]